jgi:hypothetical protein
MKFAIAAALFGAASLSSVQAATFVNALAIPNGTDASSGFGTGVNGNRLGGFGSDLIHRGSDYFGLADRGPGGGVIPYAPRIQVFGLSTDTTSGAISNFALKRTIVFTQADGLTPFNGLNPQLLNGNRSTLGASFDPEGLVIRSNGNLLVSDEYGPSIYEFTPDGRFVKSYAPPANLLPKRADNSSDYVGDRAIVTKGRQDNRGFEGLTLSPDGTKAYAILQDPLFQEGRGGQGRRGRFVRMVEFDLASGATRQFAYQLESIDTINTRTDGAFAENSQGRSIGVSSITAMPNGKFLIIERDNRGLGVDPASVEFKSGSKRVYLVDLAGATDISALTLTNGLLPAGVSAVQKSATPFLDVIAAVGGAGVIAEKLEGLAFGDLLSDNSRNLLIITDNDFSVTQLAGSDQQYDVCTDGKAFDNVALDTACTAGKSKIPTYIYSFKLSAAELQSLGFSVPEPASWMMMLAGFGFVGHQTRRRPAPAHMLQS